MNFRLFDIETVVDEAMLPLPTDKKTGDTVAFPPPPFWRIVAAASVVIGNSDNAWTVERADVLYGTDEHKIVDAIARAQTLHTPTIVTWNGRHFDLPVLVARCFRHGVAFPWYWRARGARYRFSADDTIDLMDELADYGAADRASLEAFGRACGAPAKLETGEAVAGMWERGERTRIATYCAGDVITLGFVFARWLRVKGQIAAADEQALRKALEDASPKLTEMGVAEFLEAS